MTINGQLRSGQSGGRQGGSHVSFNTSIVDDLVDVVGGHARLRSASGNVQNLTC